MKFADYAGTLPRHLFENIQVAIKHVCHVGADQNEVRAAVYTGSNTRRSRLSEAGGMLSAAAGASHHAFVRLIGSGGHRLLGGGRTRLRRGNLYFGDTGSRTQGREQERDGTRDRGTENDDLHPDAVFFHGAPSLPLTTQ